MGLVTTDDDDDDECGGDADCCCHYCSIVALMAYAWQYMGAAL